MPVVHLTLVDFQNSFVATATNPYGIPEGSLLVPGAQADADRVGALLDDIIDRVDAVHMTLDQHHKVDIAHPVWFVDDNGDPPPPFTVMKNYDADRGVFVGALPGGGDRDYRTRKLGNIPTNMAEAIFGAGKSRVSFEKYTAWYLAQLAKRKNYDHRIWPEHCLIGTQGADVYPSVAQAVARWSQKKVATVGYVSKGSNPFTEHFGGVEAEVPIPTDPSTQLNTDFVGVVQTADVHLYACEALSHCGAVTMRGLFRAFSDKATLRKTVLLTDAASNVPGCEKLGQDFLAEMTAAGMRTMTCSEARKLLV